MFLLILQDCGTFLAVVALRWNVNEDLILPKYIVVSRTASEEHTSMHP